ncbi:hypothetical protein IW150_000302 [Coemansia sp. RSA 2607]|nr:hypothetical protein IW150_000302 [Coemansia sp. RSA 2607]
MRSLYMLAHRAPLTFPIARLQHRHLHWSHTLRSPLPDPTQHPTVRKMQSNKRVMSAMFEAIQLLQRKGFVDSGNPKPPSFAQMMKMMGDQEVKDKFVEVQRVMKEEGVAFSPADLAGFMGGMGMSGDAGKMKEEGEKSVEAGGDSKEGLLGRLSSKLKFRS